LKALIKNISLIIFCCFIFYSCSKDDVITPATDTSTNFKYPFSLTSNWFFTTTQHYTFHPDSVRNYLPGIDTAVESGYAIWKNDTVINGITARVLRSNHTSTSHAYNTTESYIQTDSGLVNVSFNLDYGPSFGPYRPMPHIEFRYNGKSFNSLTELFAFFTRENFQDNASELNLVNCIRYPIAENTEWYFRTLSPNPLQIQRKKYIGYGQVSSPAGTYNCIKIQRRNYINGGTVLDTNYVSYDYYSKIGMLKRNYLIKNVGVYYFGSLIGYFDVENDVILNSAFIAP
jgi:hypothetical protein